MFMKNRKKKYFISLIIIMIVVITYVLMTKNNEFSGDIKLAKYDITENISDSNEIEVLGNYMFLYSPHPADDPNEDLSAYNSYLVITDYEKNIQEIIDLGGYYQYIDLQSNGDILLYTDESNVHVIPYIDNQYQNIEESSLTDFPEPPYVGVVTPGSIYIDQNGYVEFKNEPHSYYNEHTYLVVDFIQNTNVVEGQLPIIGF